MANRLIREGMLESEQVLGLPLDARWLYLTVLLSADDVGLFEATEFRLARRADVRRELAGKLLQMIADVDLVRLYSVAGKAYGFIPRFRQRIQIKRIRHPIPPVALFADDPDAVSKFNDLAVRSTVGQQMRIACTTAAQRPEPEPEPELRADTKKAPRKRSAAASQLVSVDELIEAGVEKQVADDWLLVRKAKTLPLTRTAWDGVIEQAGVAKLTIGEALKMAVRNGWGGFMAKWLIDEPKGAPGGFVRPVPGVGTVPGETTPDFLARRERENLADQAIRDQAFSPESRAAKAAILAKHKGGPK